MTTTTTNSNDGQQYWANQHNALNNSLTRARDAVVTLRQAYGFTPTTPNPSLTTDQQRNLEQAYQKHLEASQKVTDFLTTTGDTLSRLVSRADAIMADPQASLLDRNAATFTKANLIQASSDFFAAKASRGWQAPGELEYTIGNSRRFTSVVGIQERVDTSSLTGKAIAGFKSIAEQISAHFADSSETVKELNLPNDYEICTSVMNYVSGAALKGIFPTPDAFKTGPRINLPWGSDTAGEKIYKNGLKNSLTIEENFCRIHLNKSDPKEWLRQYGQADSLDDILNASSADEIKLTLSREVFDKVLATDTALSWLNGTANTSAASFDQQVQTTTSSLSSSSAIFAALGNNLNSAGIDALDGAQFGSNSFTVDNGLLHFNMPFGSQNAILLASLDFEREITSDAGGGGALQFQEIQVGNGPSNPLVNSVLQDANINVHDILLGKESGELNQLIAGQDPTNLTGTVSGWPSHLAGMRNS